MGHRILRSVGLALSLVAVTAGAASAHECFNNSRSDQGNVGAQHSTNWVSIGTLTELFSTPPEPGAPALTGPQVEWAVAEAKALGIPDQIVIFVGHTLAEGTPAKDRHGADGQGIDYFIDWLPALLDIYVQALQR
jgi:hypothetical protein